MTSWSEHVVYLQHKIPSMSPLMFPDCSGGVAESFVGFVRLMVGTCHHWYLTAVLASKL